jgi:hypothetical protein
MLKKAIPAIGVGFLALVLVESAAGQGVKELVKEVKEQKEPAKRIQALGKIAAMGPKAADEAGEALVEAMMDKSAAVRTKAAEALDAVDPEVHRHVVTIFIGQRKLQAMNAIAEMGPKGKAALPVVLKVLASPIPVGYVESDWSPVPIADLYLAALTAARKIAPEDKRVVRVILTLVSQDPRARLQKNQKSQPAREPDPGDFDALDPEVDLQGGRVPRRRRPMPPGPLGVAETIRLVALDNLDEMDVNAKEKVPALVAALKDPYCLMAAMRALVRMEGDAKAALPALRRLKTSPFDSVRDAATKAVRKIEKG